jgi:very-short-patch-repair endonuclease
MDARRTAWLENEGWRVVVRFWNNEVLGNTNGVIETNLRVLQTK